MRWGGVGRREIAYLAKVKLGVFLVANTFYLDERGVWARVALGALVPEDAALVVESERQRICQRGVCRGGTSGQATLHPQHGKPRDGVFVVNEEIRVNTDLVEPIFLS